MRNYCYGVVLTRAHRQPNSEKLYRAFWAPLSNSRQPAIVYIGANVLYRLSDQFMERYRAAHHLRNTGPEIQIELTPADKISVSDFVPKRKFTGWGDVAATAKVVSELTRLNGKDDLRYGDDIGITDLHFSPAILIGGFNNPWSMKLTRDFRYTLQDGDKS
jgi:hypothetical protein